MRQKISKEGMIGAIELEIDNREVFSPEFKQYAKMVYLAKVNRAMMANALDISEDGKMHLGGNGIWTKESKAAVIAEIAKSLCHVAAKAVTCEIEAITGELSDPEKLNEAMTELFGDLWDPEKREFK